MLSAEPEVLSVACSLHRYGALEKSALLK